MNQNPASLSLDSQLLTPARFAWVMDAGHSTVEQWLRTKQVTHFRKGRFIRIAPEAALAFILAHTVKSRWGMLPGPGFAAAAPALNEKQFGELWERIERLIVTQLEARPEQELTGRTEKAA